MIKVIDNNKITRVFNGKYWKGSVTIEKAMFQNKRPAYSLVSAVDGEPIARVNLNFPEENIPEDCIAVKDYAENEGMLEFLVENNLVSPTPVSYISSGHVIVPVMQLM